MVDYKPRFKPLYTGKETLVERISDVFCDSFNFSEFKGRTFKDMNDDFLTTTKNDILHVKNDFSKGKIIYSSVGVGVGAGVAGNFVTALITDSLGYDHGVIENASLVSELLFHAAGYGVTYVKMSRAEGKSDREIARDLTRTTAISIPIAVVPYPLVRNPLADFFMDGMKILPEFATVFSQTVLLPLYAKTIKYMVDRFGPKVDSYLDRIPYFKIDDLKRLQIENSKNSDNLEADKLEDVIEKAS